LAQYSEVRESLWTVLGQLTNGSEIPADSPLSEAVATLAGLVQCVADAWEAHWQLATEAVAVNAETREYTVTLSTQGELYDKLCLEQVAGAAVAAPQITCITPDGIRVALNPLSLSTEGGTWLQTYKFSADVPAFARLQFEYAFGSLPVAIFENARTRVWVTRNAQLLDLPAPPTQQSFHYRTPEIAFPDPTVPSLIYTRVFPIGQWTSDAATSPLNQVFATVLPSGVGAISFALLYGYDLAPSLQAETTISTYLPVAFCPITPFAASTVADIIAAIEAWKLKYAPNKTGGRWGRRSHLLLCVESNPSTLAFGSHQREHRVRFTTTATLVSELIEARDEKKLLRFQKQIASYELLIVDKLGFVPLSKTGAELLFEMLRHRLTSCS
jgi:hypothetical protein